MSEHSGVTSATFGLAVAAGLIGALLVVVPAAAASPAGGPPRPGDGTPSDEEPVLQPAEDDEVVVLGTDDQPDARAGPGAGGEDDTEDRPGVLGSARPGVAGAIGVGLLAFLSLALTAISVARLRRTLHAWWSPPPATAGDPGRKPPSKSFSLIVADGGDEVGFARTLEALAACDHPDVEVLAVVGHNDPRARELAAAAAYRQPHRVRVVLDRGFRRNELRALNAGLAECRGDVIGVFRAGDDVRPGLLRHVEATLEATGADALQTGVLLTPQDRGWLSMRRMVESYFWFRSRVHHYAQQRFTPLAATGVFIRTDVLRGAGGWDEAAAGAGCELGVRLSLAGVPVAVTWDPEVVTRAAMPRGARGLSRQLVGWIQGFLQVLRAGAWRRLPTGRQRVLAAATLAAPFVEAVAGATALVLVAATVAAGAPPLIVLIACAPLVPAVTTVVAEIAGFGEVRGIAAVPIGARDGLLFVVATIPYQFVRAAAALRALLREGRGRRGWDAAPRAGGPAAGADVERTDGAQVVQGVGGGRRPVDEPAIRAEAVDR